MQKKQEEILYSASDLANFLECEHLTWLDRLHLDSPMEQTEDSEDAELIQRKGLLHEKSYLEQLIDSGLSIVDITEVVGKQATTQDKVDATRQAMKDGVDVIYQATFADGIYLGHADFLRKTTCPSRLGNFSYEVIDTKLSTKAQGKFIIQLMFYSTLLKKVQGVMPSQMYVVLGNKTEAPFYCADFAAYFDALVNRFEAHVQNSHALTYPNPCKRCDLCHWRDRCEDQRIQDDHLSQVAGILKTQITKLNQAGIQTMADLAQLDEQVVVPKLNADSLTKIRHQARLQHLQKTTGNSKVELLPVEADGRHGFMRLPTPDDGDIYFDMEGNPLEDPRNLEYLFGVYFLENGQYQFKGFWALNHAEEKKAFEDFMDFVSQRLKTYPNAHIYHYAAYEETAIKRLMSFYGTRETEVDNLLREGRLIDLYKVVRESMRTSEPSYSIKNIEHFYLEKRSGEVTNAGASIIYFEKWKMTGDQQYLNDIEEYNIDDVRSTQQLHAWLINQRPSDLPWGNAIANKQIEIEEKAPKANSNTAALAEQKLERYRKKLLGHAEIPEEEKDDEYRFRELLYFLLGFHRREAKPGWWDYFSRKEKTSLELIEDTECIAGVTLDPKQPPVQVKQSLRYFCTYPEQEMKLHTGSSAEILELGKSISKLEIDTSQRTLSFTMGKRNEIPNGAFTLTSGKPIDAKLLTDAIERYADSLLNGEQAYLAITDMLNRSKPRFQRLSGNTIIDDKLPVIPQMIDAIKDLNHSYLIIQGPPGTGKTCSGSKVIVALIKQGFRVAITSNSHKAINNLLLGIDKEAQDQGVNFNGVKKSSGNDTELENCTHIQTVDSNEAALSDEFALVAGTAWLLARSEADQQFDYLFVDEAGQLSLGHLVAVSTCAKNMVLLGDQMQLGQPTQGVHPGDSSLSILEFLLQDHHTVPPNMGIFLGTSYRMHPSICQFISDAVYDGRLDSGPDTHKQVLKLTDHAHPLLRTSGIVYVPIAHTDCSQSSHEEATLINGLIEALLNESYVDNEGIEHPIELEDILVITPYNAQVNLLMSECPAGTRIGTVDKFQGQEAPIVLFSMVTSSSDDLPRDIGFLFSKNRLNVAISRAKSLVIFIANPKLMSVQCNNPNEMALVNTLCLLDQYRTEISK